MRIIFIICVALTSILPIAHADFFDEEVSNTDLEINMIDRIHLDAYGIRNVRESIRFANAIRFIDEVKQEAKIRYIAGAISYYRMNDIIRDMDALVYSLDKHFFFYKRYEQQPKKMEYRTESEEYYGVARQDYQRLRETLKRSNR